jgi:hemolysin activation/secretion protein
MGRGRGEVQEAVPSALTGATACLRAARRRSRLLVAGCVLLASLATGAAGQEPATASGQTARFAVLEYRVEGNTVLPPLVVEEAVYPHLGTGRTPEDIERARNALEEAYRTAGFLTVSVELPQQRVSDGIVRLRVVERRVGRVRVTGARYFLPSEIRREAPSIAPGTVPNINAVQRDIIALNRLPDRRVTPQLRDQDAAPGTVDFELEVEDKLPLHGSLELNNRRSANTEPLRLSGSVRYDNLWQRGDSVTVGFQTAPQRTSNATVFSTSYLWRVPGRSGASLLASAVVSNSNVGTVGGTSVLGDGTIFGLRGLLPLGFRTGFSHTATVGIDRKDFSEALRLGADRNDFPIVYYPVSASYQAIWNTERSTSILGSTVTANLSGVGSDRAEFEQRRAFATPTWAHVRADGSHLRLFDNDVQVFVSGHGQLSPDPLISNEQFPGGGLESVRGYLEVETLGDYGVSGQAEIRSPSFASLAGSRVDELRLHAFLDGATMAINRPLPQQQSSFRLLSMGGGVRVKVFERLNGSLEGAVVLRDGPLTPSGTGRALFRIWSEY